MSLKYLLLSELSKEQKTGYDIVKSFDSSVGYFWNATHQQVYRELKQLESVKLVSVRKVKQVEKPDKKLYKTTAKGIDELQQWIKQPYTNPPVRDSLLVKIHASAVVGKNEVLIELRKSQQLTKKILATYVAIELEHYSPPPDSTVSPRTRALFIALRKGILSSKSHLTWLNEAILILDG